MTLRSFNYSLLRFVPDVARGEAVNLGVIAVDDEAGAIRYAFMPDVRRKIRPLAPGFNSDAIASEVARIGKQVTTAYQPALTGPVDARIATTAQLATLAGAMRNELQLSEPRPYRAESLSGVVQELYHQLVLPVAPPVELEAEPDRQMPLKKLRALIWKTIKDWGEEVRPKEAQEERAPRQVRIVRSSLEEAHGTRHYADFWLEVGQPIAALIAIPEDPDESHVAWARRDSVPTISAEFRKLEPRFKVVAVFPPDGRELTPFVEETMDFLGAIEGVLVARADELENLRSEIVPSLL